MEVWNGIWKKILVWNGRFLVWNGRKLSVWNMEKSSSIPFLWYGSMEWNMKKNFSMEWNMDENFSMEWKIFGMEWKKIASMEYGKIVFHTMP